MICEIEQSFAGKVVVIVSASLDRGELQTTARAKFDIHMGELLAVGFAAAGAHVIVLDSNPQVLGRLASQIEASGGIISTHQVDVALYDNLVMAAKSCVAKVGAVHVLINCQSDIELASFESSSPESWQRVIQFDVLGPVFASKAFLPLLKRAGAQGGASVIHIGSIDGTLGNPKVASYSTAKGALVPLTHVMAADLAEYGIRVNCIARAITRDPDMPLNPSYPPLIAQTPLRRPAFPNEIVDVAKFLASTSSAYVTGTVIPVDGGRSGVTPGTFA